MRREQDRDIVASRGRLGARSDRHLDARVGHGQCAHLGSHRLPQPRRRLRPRCRQECGRFVERRGRGIPLRRQTLDAVAVVIEFGEARRSRLEQRDRRIERAVGAHQRTQHGTSLFDRRQLVRAGLIEIREVAGECRGEIRGTVAEVGGLIGELLQGGIIGCFALEGAPRFGDEHHDVGFVPLARQRFVRGRGGEPQGLRVGEPLRAGGEVDVLIGHGSRLLDLGDRRAQLFGLARSRIAIGRERLQLAFDGAEALERGAIRR